MKRIKAIMILFLSMLLLGSCVKEPLSTGDNIVEGESALVKMSMEASFVNDTPSTRVAMSENDENKYKDVRVMVFKPTGEVVTNYKEVYPTATAKPELTIKTYSGRGRSIYIIANVVDDVDRRLSVVQSLDQLNAMSVTATEFGNGLSGKPLTMIGSKIDVDIKAGSSTLPTMQMQFMVPRLTLEVIDNTPNNHSVTLLGWDIENAPQSSFLILNGGGSVDKDFNTGKEADDAAWISTKDAVMSFDRVEDNAGKKTAYLTQYIFENRRGGRVDNQPLPTITYPGMSLTDGDNRGKAWFAPKKATCIVIHAMHKTPSWSKNIEARIYFGGDNHSNYDIARGTNYQFTVKVNGIDDIDIDTSLEPTNSSFAVHTSAPLYSMDAHPDFRPVMISAEYGKVSIEILDSYERSYGDPEFDATWVKISPLNLMYHQVRQAAPNDVWQQPVGPIGGFVRSKYIPHRSVRGALEAQGITGWNPIPNGKENDDEMTFADATHRMCYKITNIPFEPGTVTSKTLYVYTDDYPKEDLVRSAKVKIIFQPNGTRPDGSAKEAEERILPINQRGYLTIYDEANVNAGLSVLNVDGSLTSRKMMFGVERLEEVAMQLNPGIDASVQTTNTMQWGFLNDPALYTGADKVRNGFFQTANAVYENVGRSHNEPVFGISNPYRPMYGNNHTGGFNPIMNYGSGPHSGSPYYYPSAIYNIYHPIYKSSASRYCHEKNRDLNGDGYIDRSETHWYLPSSQELQMLWIFHLIPLNNVLYWSTTNTPEASSVAVHFGGGNTFTTHLKNRPCRVRCVRELWR